MSKIVLGTRGSKLALWQARHVADRLIQHHPGLEIEEKIIQSEGDLHQVDPLKRSDVGVFVRRLEEAMLAGKIDLAVHSLKDLPTDQPDGLAITAVPPRHDPRDVVLHPEGRTFEQLPAGTVIGTGSYRRRAQLLHLRPELRTESIRGNVDTRIRKLAEGQYGAVVLALAGIERLGLDRMPYQPIATETCLPAVGQGALGLETRVEDAATRALLEVLDHSPSHHAVRAERAFLRTLGGGCLAPATGFAVVEGDRLRIDGAVGDEDGRKLLRDEESGSAADDEQLGTRLAQRMIEKGADELLRQAREAAERDGRG